MALWRFAWRNLWRNTRRTAITLAAVGLNTAILIATFALMDGMRKDTIENATNMVVGEVQVHAPEYLVRGTFYDSLKDPERVLEKMREEGVWAAARSYGYGLAALGSKSAGARFWGVDPERERAAFDLAEHVAQGDFLSREPKRGVVLGKKLARTLNAKVGSEVVVVVQAADGSLGNELFTVRGILKAAGEKIDRTAAIMHRADFRQLFVSGKRIHEIALNSKGRLGLEELKSLARAAAPGEEVETWRELMPQLSDILNLYDVSLMIFGLIFFLAAGLGVMNTMLMATFERMREFGILKALGTSPWRIVRDVTAEALVLGLTATVLGTALGVAGSWYLRKFGIDTSALTSGDVAIGGVAFDPVWRAAVSLKMVLWPVAGMWLICILAALYPAAIAARLDPVKAIHQS